MPNKLVLKIKKYLVCKPGTWFIFIFKSKDHEYYAVTWLQEKFAILSVMLITTKNESEDNI